MKTENTILAGVKSMFNFKMVGVFGMGTGGVVSYWDVWVGFSFIVGCFCLFSLGMILDWQKHKDEQISNRNKNLCELISGIYRSNPEIDVKDVSKVIKQISAATSEDRGRSPPAVIKTTDGRRSRTPIAAI